MDDKYIIISSFFIFFSGQNCYVSNPFLKSTIDTSICIHKYVQTELYKLQKFMKPNRVEIEVIALGAIIVCNGRERLFFFFFPGNKTFDLHIIY